MTSWAPLPLRIAIGIVFSVKGWWVLFEELGQRSEYYSQLGLPLPLLLASAFGTVEILGGASLLLGLYVRQISALLLFIEVIAIGPVHAERGFVLGSALTLLLCGVLLSLFLSGPGRLCLKK